MFVLRLSYLGHSHGDVGKKNRLKNLLGSYVATKFLATRQKFHRCDVNGINGISGGYYSRGALMSRDLRDVIIFRAHEMFSTEFVILWMCTRVKSDMI